ncbi:MAG: TRAP transporter small permease subunit, partial [Myxococcota bacterium]|nr:TRAP transporter small permease subunit [Myxococcota bacterium]
MSVRAAVDRVLGTLLVVLMAASVVNVLWQVLSRYVLGSPSSFTDELARYLLVWVGLLGSAYAAGQRLHVAVDLLPGRTGRLRAASTLLAHGVV